MPEADKHTCKSLFYRNTFLNTQVYSSYCRNTRQKKKKPRICVKCKETYYFNLFYWQMNKKGWLVLRLFSSPSQDVILEEDIFFFHALKALLQLSGNWYSWLIPAASIYLSSGPCSLAPHLNLSSIHHQHTNAHNHTETHTCTRTFMLTGFMNNLDTPKNIESDRLWLCHIAEKFHIQCAQTNHLLLETWLGHSVRNHDLLLKPWTRELN